MLLFCIIIPADYDTMLNKPAIELALSEIAAARGLMSQVRYIDSPYNLQIWQLQPWTMMRMITCQTAIVAGMDGFAGTLIQDNLALLGGWAFWALNWGDDNIMPRDYPYWGVYLNRRSQMGAILHEVDHLLCQCGDLGHTRGTPWERLF